MNDGSNFKESEDDFEGGLYMDIYDDACNDEQEVE